MLCCALTATAFASGTIGRVYHYVTNSTSYHYENEDGTKEEFRPAEALRRAADDKGVAQAVVSGESSYPRRQRNASGNS